MRYLCLLIGVVLIAGCGPAKKVTTYKIPEAIVTSLPGYDNLDYWAAHPWKKDFSDSVPLPLRNEKQDSLADVFFIYPTTYTGTMEGWNANISDSAINMKTDKSSILFQATAFNGLSRVFAPRYRQSHLSAFYTNTKEALASFDTAYADIKTAFELYLNRYNNGRPIIIAGHSQGAKMASQLLKEYFDGKPLYKQLVVAYIVGWPVPKNYFSAIPVGNSPTQTGCFCTWRTYRTGYVPEYIVKEKPQSYVTNPLTWKTNENYSPRFLNKGSVLRNLNEIIKNSCDAQVHGGVLWINKPKFPGGVLYTSRNYHIGDINLFYINIRENVAERIHSFLKGHK